MAAGQTGLAINIFGLAAGWPGVAAAGKTADDDADVAATVGPV